MRLQAMARLKELAQSGIHFCVGLDLEPYGAGVTLLGACLRCGSCCGVTAPAAAWPLLWQVALPCRRLPTQARL